MDFVNVLSPSRRAFVNESLSFVGCSLGLGLLAQIEVPLWFTPVPITLQTFGVMLIAALCGGRRGFYALLVYLAEGALGVPVFAGGSAGVAVLMGPTGGYLFGFPIAAFLMGSLLEKRKSFSKILLTMLVGSLVMLGSGALWLSFLVGGSAALKLGVYPFLIGSGLKSLAASSLIFSYTKRKREKHNCDLC